MPHPILNIADVELKPWPAAHLPAGETAQRFEARFGPIGALIGARKLGYKITAVPPGKSAFPFHNHHANEEMVFVLQGSGTVRIGARRYPLRTGDVVALPCGGTDTAHQVINTGSEELRYLDLVREDDLRLACIANHMRIRDEIAFRADKEA